MLERHDVHMCAVQILDAADHAVVRTVVDKPELAVHELTEAGYQVFTTDLRSRARARRGTRAQRSSQPSPSSARRRPIWPRW